MISLTENAAKEIRRIMQENSLSEAIPVRLGIKGGGCAGFTYYFDFEQKTPDKFDRTFESQSLKVIVDRKSLLYIDGTEVIFDILTNAANRNSQEKKTLYLYLLKERGIY